MIEYYKEVHKMTFLCAHTLNRLISEMIKLNKSAQEIQILIG